MNFKTLTSIIKDNTRLEKAKEKRHLKEVTESFIICNDITKEVIKTDDVKTVYNNIINMLYNNSNTLKDYIIITDNKQYLHIIKEYKKR
jgi:hypothetical protein